MYDVVLKVGNSIRTRGVEMVSSPDFGAVVNSYICALFVGTSVIVGQ